MVLTNSVSIHRVCTWNAFGGERRVVDDGAVERQHRRHALDLHLVQRAAGPGQRLSRVGAGDDELGQQRVERPPITEPVSMPESTRTPGPAGATNW